MKLSKKIVICVFLLIIILTVICSGDSIIKSYRSASEYDDIYYGKFDIAIGMMISVPAIIAEIDLLFDTLFFMKRNCIKNKISFAFHAVSAALSTGIFILPLLFRYNQKTLEALWLCLIGLYLIQKLGYLIYKSART